MANVLSGFDPLRARKLLENCTHQELAESFRSKHAYNQPNDE